MNNESIAIFLNLANTKSFSHTASRMLVTKQMVSKAVQSLEEELNVQLFLRDKRTVEMTAAGEMFRDFFRTQSAELYRSELHRARDEADGRFFLAVDEWIDLSPQLVRALRTFRERSGKELRLLYVGEGRGVANLMAGRADVLLASRYTVRPFESFCRIWPYAELELRVQTHPLYPRAASEQFLTGGDLTVLTSFAGENTPAEARSREAALCERCGVAYKEITVLPNMATAKLNIVLRNGVSILPVRPVSPEFIQIPTSRTATAAMVYLQTREDAAFRPLLEILRQTYGEEAGQ